MTLWLALMILAQQPAAGPDIREQIACAPMSLDLPPVSGIRVVGSYQRGRLMFAPGEPVIISAGSRQGLQKGQVYFVRRYVHDNFTPASIDFVPVSIHTAGWVTIVDTRDDLSVAQVTHACDGVLEGDYLEPYTDPVMPPPALGGEPDYASPARVVMGDQKMQMGSAGSLMLINRGSNHGVRAGQTLTIFRDTLSGIGPVLNVGTATVLSVRPQTALIRIDASREAVYIGDKAAIHRIQ